MAVGHWGWGAAEFTRLHQPEEKQRGTDKGEDDTHERGRDVAEREQIEEKARAESGDDRFCRFPAGEVVSPLHQLIKRERWSVIGLAIATCASRPGQRLRI